MEVSENEIQELRIFISNLNSKKDCAVIVEGKRDSNALKQIGFTGKLLEFHHFGGLIKFADAVAVYPNLIILMDGDRKGKYLTRRIIEQLQHRTKIDLSFKKKLISITKGKIRFIEELSIYETLI